MVKRSVNNIRKFVFSILIVFSLVMSLPTGVSAADTTINVVVDNVRLDFPDAKPFADSNYRTQTPASFITKALGATVVWNGKEQKAVFAKENDELIIFIGKAEYLLNGRQMKMDTVAIAKDNRTFVPAKYVAEAFGASVRWDGTTRTVYITSRPTAPQLVEGVDIPDGTVINNRAAFIDKLQEASITLQPQVVLQCENYTDSEYDLEYLNLDGINQISSSMLITGSTAKITVSIEYTQGFRLQQALNNKKAEGRLTTKDRTVVDEMNEILNEVITPGMTDYEKELALHDYLVLNSKYDYINFQQGTLQDDAYTPYGLLVNGTGVCQAYAETMNFLLNFVGIESRVVTGTADGIDHAWNIVKLEGEYYMLDVTWDDPVPDEEGQVSYTYFNVTGSQLSRDHIWDKAKWHAANGSKYNYYQYNNLVVNSYSEFKQLVINKIQAGQKEIQVYINNYEEDVYDLNFIFNYYEGTFRHTIPESAYTSYTIFLQ